MTEEIKRLEERLKNLIINTCNKIGCGDCPYKWDGGCSSDALQNQLLDAEAEEWNTRK